MRWGARAGNVTLYDRLRPRPRTVAAGIALRRHQRHDRDRREPGAATTASRARRPTHSPPRSHQRAAAAWEAGKFDDEIVPVDVPQRSGEPVVFERDEGVRPDTTHETLAQLRAVMRTAW